MAAVSSTTATLLSGFPRANPRATSALSPRSKALRVRHAARLGESIGLHVNLRVPMVFASDVNPSDPDTGKDQADSSSPNVADGPPLPTILAGVFVFLLICWFIGSIVMWLVGLIVNVPSS